MSRTRDTDQATAAALDYGLSQRALIAVSARSSDRPLPWGLQALWRPRGPS
ncbi:hypothetical protein ACGF8B_40610 [Streptomyces sp. NPDC047917]|uniref:hypothetical protein n=1 Tax=Streptomyces sp. NPDC047917 TaxID=3365491 RepID=UPI00370FCF38